MSTSVIECGHEGCKKSVDMDEEFHTCSLCRSPIYCSDECYVAAWPLHNCANALRIQGAPRAMLEPYYYEDTLSAEEVAALPLGDPVFQERAYLFANDNRNVGYYSGAVAPTPVEGNAVSENGRMPQVRGSRPNSAGSYILKISLGNAATAMVKGSIPHDLIFAENTSNVVARKLAGFGGTTFKERVQGLRRRLYAKEGSLIFWPGPSKVKAARLVTSELGGDIEVSLGIYPDASSPSTSPATEVAFVRAGYLLSANADGFWRNMSRSVKRTLSQHLQLKFAATGDDVKQMQVLAYADTQGNGVLLTWSVDGMRAQLIDIEFMTSKLQAEGLQAGIGSGASVAPHGAILIEDRFLCDVRSINDVAGLAMALDEHLGNQMLLGAAAGPVLGDQKQLEQYAGIIKNFAYSLQDALENGTADALVVPPAVNVAIAAAMDVLYTRIEESAAWWNKKAEGDFTVFETKANAVVAKMQALRGKSGVRGKIASVQKHFLQGELDRISNAIGKQLRILRQRSPTDPLIDQFQALLAKVQNAKQSQ